MNIKETALILAGGLLGTLLRYQMLLFPIGFSQLRLNVIVINILGNFLAGFFLAFFARYPSYAGLSPLIIIGFCGAFTTMSAFILETVILIREGYIALGFFNLMLNIIGSFLSALIGIKLMS